MYSISMNVVYSLLFKFTMMMGIRIFLHLGRVHSLHSRESERECKTTFSCVLCIRVQKNERNEKCDVDHFSFFLHSSACKHRNNVHAHAKKTTNTRLRAKLSCTRVQKTMNAYLSANCSCACRKSDYERSLIYFISFNSRANRMEV